MRTCKLLLPVAAALAAAATASAASPVSTGYVWAQPGRVLLANPFAQMPAWLVTTPTPTTLDRLPLLTTYVWAQPGTAPTDVPDAQPWSL
jgi:hypothetical protein